MTESRLSNSLPFDEVGGEQVLVDNAVAVSQVILVRSYLSDKLSRVWDGWNDLSNSLLRITEDLAKSSRQTPVINLTNCELDDFINTILPSGWHHRGSASRTITVPQNVISLLEDASRNVSIRRQEREAEQRSEIESLKKKIEDLQHNGIQSLRDDIEILKLLHPMKECVHEFSRPFVAKAVEIDGINDGEFYIVQGLRRDGRWVTLFSRQHRVNETGLQMFRNDVEYASYKLLCMNERARMKLHRVGDEGIFHKGVPALTSAAQDGYVIDSSPVWDQTFVAVNAFNDRLDNAWHSVKNPGTSWLQLRLPRPRIFNAVEIVSRREVSVLEEHPKDFRIEGSCDGKTWKILCEKRDVAWNSGNQRQVFTFENDIEFPYYRLAITSSRCDQNSYHSFCLFNLGNRTVCCGDPVSLIEH